MINVTIIIIYPSKNNKTYYEMTATDKRTLISESVTTIWIGVHPVGEEPDQHVVRMTPRVSRTTTVRVTPEVSRMTTVCEVPTKSKSGLCSQDEVLAPSDVWPDRHPGLPHSPSNKPPRSKEVQFDEVVTGLLGLPGPINPTCGQYKSKLTIRAKTTQSLIDTSRGYHHGTSE
jgi:hypothetical protein